MVRVAAAVLLCIAKSSVRARGYSQSTLRVLSESIPLVRAPATAEPNICAANSTLGTAVLAAVNLSYPGLETAAAAAAKGDRGTACQAIADYYRHGDSASWLRIGPVTPGTGMMGGSVDAMVLNDSYTGFPSPPGPVTIPRTANGGLNWTWWGPDHDDEFMNVLNRHSSFTSCLNAWNTTGNKLYATYFDSLVRDWVTNLPCNNANSTATGHAKCQPLSGGRGERNCQWDPQTLGGTCATGTFESPWRSLEMGIRMAGPWPESFFGFQQADAFSTSGRVLMLLGISEHFRGLLVDGGHPGHGTVNWEMTQWRGLLSAAAAFPEINGANQVATASMKYLTAFLDQGVYPDGVENEMASGYDMGTAQDYFQSLKLTQLAGMPPPPESYTRRVEAMYEYGAYVADPDGCLPMNGDSDLCGHGFDPKVSHFFNRSDWDYVRTNGKFGRAPTGSDHATPSVMFPWAGQAVMRSSYEAGATWLWFDVGPFGSNPFHAHRDKLEVLLHAHGSTLLEDSGRFAYSGNSFSHSMRPYCHTTQAHNTIRIDGKQQKQAPAIAKAPRPVSSWSFRPDRDIVQGSMAQYDGLEGKATHSRSVYHQRGHWIVIVDVITSDRGPRTVQAAWHTHPNSTVTVDATTGVANIRGVDLKTEQQSNVCLALIPATGAQFWNSSKVVKGQLAGKDGATEDQGWYSEHYSDATAAPTLVYDAQINQKQAVFAWLLLVSQESAENAGTETNGASAVVADISAHELTIKVSVSGGNTSVTIPFEIA